MSQNLTLNTNSTVLANALAEAKMFHNAGCFSSSWKNEYQIYTAIQFGKELGFTPIQSLNVLYLVNGRMNIHSNGKTAYLRNNGYTINYNDEADKAGKPLSTTVTVSKGNEKYVEKVSIGDLPATSKAKGFAPFEKLRYHALQRIINFNLAGIVSPLLGTNDEEINPIEKSTQKVFYAVDNVQSNQDVNQNNKVTEMIDNVVEDSTELNIQDEYPKQDIKIVTDEDGNIKLM